MSEELDKRMKDAGMMTVDEMVANNPMDKFIANVGVTDLESFERWLVSKRTEFLRMQARYELDQQQDDELYEWVISHNAVFAEVLVNFRNARSEINKH